MARISPSTLALALAAGLAAPRALAQTLPAAAAPQTTGCAAKAALFSGDKGFKAWIIRSGTMERADPLRPLDAETIQVLEAQIGSKRATAYGPDYQTLRRGLSVPDLQATNGGAAIRWSANLDGLPRDIRIVADDGAPLADLHFQECGDAPKAAPAPRTGGKPRPAKKKAAPEAAPPGLHLPQGAIP